MPYDRDNLPIDAAILGGTGALGYGRYRLGSYMTDLNRRVRKAFRDAGVSDSAKVNDALIDEFRTLKRVVSDTNPARNAYTYSDIMHRAANMPLFEGGKALGTDEGLEQFHKLIQNMGDTVAPDISKGSRLTYKIGKRLGVIGKDGKLTIIQPGLEVPNWTPEDIKGFFGNAAATKENKMMWAGTSAHFKHFMKSPLDGYRQLVHEARMYGDPALWKKTESVQASAEIKDLKNRLASASSEEERKSISEKLEEVMNHKKTIDAERLKLINGEEKLVERLDAKGNKVLGSDGKPIMDKVMKGWDPRSHEPYGHFAWLINESQNFGKNGFKDRDSYLRHLIWSQFSGQTGGGGEFNHAFDQLVNDLKTRGGGSYNGILYNTIGLKDFMGDRKIQRSISDLAKKFKKAPAGSAEREELAKALRTEVGKLKSNYGNVRFNVLQKLYAFNEKRVKDGLKPMFEGWIKNQEKLLAEEQSRALQTLLKTHPAEHILNLIGGPGTPLRHGMQNLGDVLNNRIFANNIIDPIAGGIAKKNTEMYAGISRLLQAGNTIRSRGFRNMGRMMKGTGALLPLLGAGAVAYRNGAFDKKASSAAFDPSNVINMNNVSNKGLETIVTSAPNHWYDPKPMLKRVKGPALGLAGLTLILAGLIKANRSRK
jgi:hypothetical protein